MKTILRIARLELSILFYSPVAWLALMLFAFQTGIEYASLLDYVKRFMDSGSIIPGITSTVFTGRSGLFDDVEKTLYLYIPMLTMGLMSREINSGSIKLLLSSPVKVHQIVLGKYFAMMAYGLLLVSVLLLITLST